MTDEPRRRKELGARSTTEGAQLISQAGQLTGESPKIELSPDETCPFDLSPPLPPVGAGTTIGDFEVLEILEKGPSAVTCRARQRSRDREVALRVLSPHLCHLDVAVQRFREEARLATRLADPGLVPVYGLEVDEIYHHYAMKLMAEPTLEEFMENALGQRGETFYVEAARIYAQLCRTVAGLHAAGVVHRDIKPSKLFLIPGERLILGDFASAAEIGSDGGLARSSVIAGDHEETHTGTPAYMAPERFVNDECDTDPRADIYSLGMTLYELVTGVLPFPRCSSYEEVARLKLTRKPPSPRKNQPALPLGLEAVIRQAVQTHVSLRYGRALDMARDLERFANNRRPNTRSHPGVGGYDDDPEASRDDDDPVFAPTS